MKKKLLYIIGLVILVLVIALVIIIRLLPQTPQQIEAGLEEMGVEAVSWKEAELVDVITGEQFKISDFAGKPILLESFAVWCPTCKEQQDEVKALHDELGEEVVSISIDTDPNEEVSQVLEHVNRYGYDWYFAISPLEVTRALIDEFGLKIVSAPSAPVVLVCEDQKARFLDSGVKKVEELKAEIEKGC